MVWTSYKLYTMKLRMALLLFRTQLRNLDPNLEFLSYRPGALKCNDKFPVSASILLID